MDGTFPEGVVADGCRKKCEKDEVLIVNVAKNDWSCVPKSFRKFSQKLVFFSKC
jgi:hypothetical protein